MLKSKCDEKDVKELMFSVEYENSLLVGWGKKVLKLDSIFYF